MEESRTTMESQDASQENAGAPPTGQKGTVGQPSDRVRAAFASAIESLKADMGADGANEGDIASSLKTKIREILNEEISKKQQASSVMTAASALTSLCDMSEKSNQDDEEEEDSSPRVATTEKSTEEKKGTKRPANRDDIPMSFPQKLMEILDDKNNEHIITWLPHGKAFLIYQKKKFATEILPSYFKESKYTSFTRKLNRWGFVRVTKGPEIGAYYHKCFQRGNYLLCMQMSCQSSNKGPQRRDASPQAPGVEHAHRSVLMNNPAFFAQAGVASSLGQLQGLGMPHQMASFGNRSVTPQYPPQMDALSQQIKLLNLQRGANMAAASASQGGAQAAAGSYPAHGGSEQFSSAVVSAAVDALQRSYDPQSGQHGCGMQKPQMAPATSIQQQIERYNQFGVMHPALYSAVMQQQAAAAAMLRAEQSRQKQAKVDDRDRRSGRTIAKRAHAA